MKTETAQSSSVTVPARSGLFLSPEGKSYAFTFVLVSSLFLLWGFCNGMIDVMDKHFQEELKLSLSQSAWVQFAHYLGYFLMALPAGWLATRLGYKGGIIAGLLLVAVGGLWFIPATKIAAFWAFLTGVCAIAAGLTFLETVANPYTTVLGPAQYGATRINLAQSCNGVGWILGPIAGGLFFYGKDASGRSTGAETLWIPYAGVAVVVLVLAVVFFFAPVPDVKSEDDYHMESNDKAGADAGAAAPAKRGVMAYLLLLANATVLIAIFGMILWLILSAAGLGPKMVGLASSLPTGTTVTEDNALAIVLTAAGFLAFIIATISLWGVTKRLSNHSIWAHEHFSGATLAQFFYVAAQAGIFSFLINYVTSEPPSMPSSWLKESTSKWIEIRTTIAPGDFKDVSSLATKLADKPDPFTTYVASKLSPSTVETITRHRAGKVDATAVRVAITQDLNSLIQKENLCRPERFPGMTLSLRVKDLLAAEGNKRDFPRLNRMLLAELYPNELAFQDGIIGVSNQGAANLVSFGFACFLIGRITGAFLLKRYSANKIVFLYGALNVAACGLIFLKLGWLSVACVFLSYFFMSIMFPTIFALGIFGLGVRAKKASAFIVMAIMGGAILPKVMGHVADLHGMSRSFIVPLVCFALIAAYGYFWPRLSKTEGVHLNTASGGH